MNKAQEVYELVAKRKEAEDLARSKSENAKLSKMRTYLFDSIDNMTDYTVKLEFDLSSEYVNVCLNILKHELELSGFDVKRTDIANIAEMVISVEKYKKD